ncbi:TPA: EAL domain-containing protein [Vibrio parahaemolyticus]
MNIAIERNQDIEEFFSSKGCMFPIDNVYHCDDVNLNLSEVDLIICDTARKDLIIKSANKGVKYLGLVCSSNDEKVFGYVINNIRSNGMTFTGSVFLDGNVNHDLLLLMSRFLCFKNLEFEKTKGFIRSRILGNIVPYFQAKFDIESGTLSGVEVLARYVDECNLHMPIAPEHFIPILEKFGLLDELLFSLIHQSISIMSVLPKGISISFNVTITQLENTNFSTSFMSFLNSFNKDLTDIILEITEEKRVSNSDNIIKNMNDLASVGILFSIDDFGKEFSSMNRFLKFDFKEVKIDASIIEDIDINIKTKAVISNMINLAKELDFNLVFEGVERQEQVDEIKKLGGNIMQGYLFGKPFPESEFLELYLSI